MWTMGSRIRLGLDTSTCKHTGGEWGKGARGGCLVTLTWVRSQLAHVGSGREADIRGGHPHWYKPRESGD